MPTLHVAAAQINSHVGQPAENFARLRRQVLSAAAVGVEAILFAETSLHAYDLSPDNLALAEPVAGPLLEQVGRLAAQTGLTIIPGFLERAGRQVYNSQAVVTPNGVLAVQRKYSLTPGELAAGLTPGPRERQLFVLNGVSCALLICADTGIPNIDRELVAAGVQLRFIPTAGGDLIEGQKVRPLAEAELATAEGQARYDKYRRLTFRPEAILPPAECASAFVSANALGFDGRSVSHMGHCMIVDAHGVMRAQLPGTIVREHHLDQLIHAILNFPNCTPQPPR